MVYDSPKKWPAPDNRLISYRFFLHFADFIDYIREGVKAAYPDDTAYPWVTIRTDPWWEDTLKRLAWLFGELARACALSPKASKDLSIRWIIFKSPSLGSSLGYKALGGDGSLQVTKILDCGMVMEAFMTRTLLSKRPIAQGLIRGCVLERLRLEVAPLQVRF